ncbi:CocE/NonD family hydrolase [Azospirillum picis]|uniref:CocE/NonD family hydrolase n=1 Tax=Azospirillum picis TaxID=488438 RepID=A0ABU0MP36_9PROT|nr:CocE/NonD family hydrolase [Azospirillum picis]MBP2301395.1 putative CocE/NonD family hydrolase [Azospirillum picis]MDQ0535226.1 putative CocE/NonD family hydrolase [Azospirillum picis]
MTHLAPMIHLSHALLPVRPPETVSMRTRDGIRLDADLYRPDAAGTWPVLLLRTACGRRVCETSHYAHPRWYAARGYVVVVQDVRGRGTSDGRFRPFEAEREDGADAVAWAASLPGSSGSVGMYGRGYAGMAQWLAMAEAPSALRAIAPAFAGWDVYSDWAYEGGAFRLADAMGWALAAAAESARRVEDGTGHRLLSDAVRALPVDDEIPSRPQALRDYARYSHYDDWLTNPLPGPAWDALSPRAMLPGMAADVAVLQLGGWYDPRLAGILDAHEALAARGRAPVRLVVGPWGAVGPAALPDGAPDGLPDLDGLQLPWFDRVLKGEGSMADRGGPVRLHDVESGRWHDLPSVSPAAAALHLASDGLANRQGGRLAVEPPDLEALDVVVHDPRCPVPSVGGHAMPSSAGRCDRAAVDRRHDVAVYTSLPLEEPLILAGRVALDLWVEADAPSFDVSAVLSVVRPDGQVLALTQGHARVEPGDPTRPLTIGMRAACATLAPGSALRLSLAGSCFPAYPVNPGTGAEPGETRRVDALPITLLIHSGPDRPSRLRLAAGMA